MCAFVTHVISVPVCKTLSDDERDKLAEVMEEVSFDRNERIIAQGDSADAMWVSTSSFIAGRDGGDDMFCYNTRTHRRNQTNRTIKELDGWQPSCRCSTCSLDAPGPLPARVGAWLGFSCVE